MQTRNKILAFLLCFFVIGALPISADSAQVGRQAQDIIDSIIACKLKDAQAQNLQQWIDSSLSDGIGMSAEWYVISISQSGSYDFSSYETALTDYLSKNTVRSASTRQKYALALLAVGSRDAYIYSVMQSSIGEQGIMSYIYGLHLLNNGCSGSTVSETDVKAKLLELQLSDGGWAVSGTTGDVDVTAMALQALAPHCKNDENIKSAVDRALSMLSARQLDTGDYSSYGEPNAESTAQVITALSALGIDSEGDSRFQKNENTPFDGILKYRLADGSFSHKEGEASNENATAQVLYSMTAYKRMTEGKSGLYIFDACATSDDETEGESVADTSQGKNNTPAVDGTEDTADGAADDGSNAVGGYKLWAFLGISAFSAVTAVLLVIFKKAHKKNIAVLLAVTAVAVCTVIFTDIKSAEDYYSSQEGSKENIVGTVTLSIRCDTVVGKSDSEYIPADGVILKTSEFDIDSDDTVYDIMTEAVRKYGLHMESSGTDGMIYICGINYLYEFDYGDLSGWTYHINGKEMSVGCDSYILSDGDEIEWQYTCELGQDLKQ